MKTCSKDHILGIVCIALASVVLILASRFPAGNSQLNIPGPAFFPNVLAILLIFCGGYHIILGFVNHDTNRVHIEEWVAGLKTREVRVLMAVIGLIIFFIIFNEILGFIPCLIILLLSIMRLLGVPWRATIIGTVVIAGLILFLFGTVFHVSLPSGVLSYLGL